MYTCLNGTPHQHSLAVEGRACYGLIKLPGSVTPTPSTSYLDARITPRQLKFIEDLGGDPVHAAKLSKSEASAYIDRLKKEGRVTTEPVKTKRDQQLDMLAALITNVPDGYFATQVEEGAKIHFLRISRPKVKRGSKFGGAVKIQTQHGPRLEVAAALWPSGKWSLYGNYNIVEILLLLVVDARGCAMRYARELGRCCRCNAELTDDRSRYYGIGPECEKHWPEIIAEVDEYNALHSS